MLTGVGMAPPEGFSPSPNLHLDKQGRLSQRYEPSLCLCYPYSPPWVPVCLWSPDKPQHQLFLANDKFTAMPLTSRFSGFRASSLAWPSTWTVYRPVLFWKLVAIPIDPFSSFRVVFCTTTCLPHRTPSVSSLRLTGFTLNRSLFPATIWSSFTTYQAPSKAVANPLRPFRSDLLVPWTTTRFCRKRGGFCRSIGGGEVRHVSDEQVGSMCGSVELMTAHRVFFGSTHGKLSLSIEKLDWCFKSQLRPLEARSSSKRTFLCFRLHEPFLREFFNEIKKASPSFFSRKHRGP